MNYVEQIILGTIAVSTMAIASVSAMTPTLSLATQSGTNYTFNVTGDASQPVTLYYHSTASPSVYTGVVVGNTSKVGTLQFSFNTTSYNAVANDSVYIVVNGQTSSLINLNNTNGSNTISLSTSSLSLYSNQQGTVTAYNIANSLAVASSNTNIATAYVSGSTIYVTGVNTGTANISVSGVNTSNQYVNGTIYVTVNGTSTNTISFSQPSISLVAGLQGTVTAYNMNSMSVSSSNTNIATASVSGSVIYINAINSGTAYIYVTGTNTSNQAVSGTITVVVSGTSTSSGLALSQYNLNIAPQQNGTITVYNSYGNLSAVSSNNSIAVATVSGSSIIITGVNNGTANITVSGTNWQGQTTSHIVYVTVSGGINPNPGTGPWTVNVCGYSGYKYTCQNITVNSYEEYLYLTKYNKTIGGNLKYPNKHKTRASQNIQARINQLNRQIEHRMQEIQRRIGNINMRF